MASHKAIFSVSESSCCKNRIRITLGSKKLCIDWREARDAARTLKNMANHIQVMSS